MSWLGVRVVYDKFARFVIKIWWFRGFCLLGVKYFFARRSFGAAVGDFIRNTVGSLGLMHVSWNKKRLNEALERLDGFSHEGKPRKISSI